MNMCWQIYKICIYKSGWRKTDARIDPCVNDRLRRMAITLWLLTCNVLMSDRALKRHLYPYYVRTLGLFSIGVR